MPPSTNAATDGALPPSQQQQQTAMFSIQKALHDRYATCSKAVEQSVCHAVDQVPKVVKLQGCPWPCMSLTRRSALRWHVGWHGLTWPAVPPTSVELRLDECY